MRVYCPDLPTGGDVALSSEEAEHAVRVFRMKVGDRCELFDGRGNWAIAIFNTAQKRTATVRIQEYHQSCTKKDSELIVGIGLPRGDRQRNVIERATELDVDTIVPLNCEFSVAVATDNSVERARRTVIESCKQSGRNRLMDISMPLTYSEWISTDETSTLRLICHPRLEESVGIRDLSKLREQFKGNNLGSVVLAVGPEGGFSDDEVQLAIKNDWIPLDLGPLILRVETALCVAVTIARSI
jgi:16S rRNA (uracil1498-N3)-methyltransferase